MSARSPEQLHRSERDPRLEVFVERMIAVDGSFFDALPRMSWAMYRPECGNCKVKLHLLLESLRGGLADAQITAGNTCERKTLKKMIKAGKPYVGDRYYGMEYDYFDCFANYHFIRAQCKPALGSLF